MKNVAVIAPAGSIENPEKLIAAQNFMKQFNIETKIYPGCYETFRGMAGCDEIRLNDLHNAYLDKDIDTIICARGGYGAIRLLDKIDYNIIKNNPKKLVGSSDITALLIAIHKKTGQINYHAKMALNGISEMKTAEFLNYKNSIENNIYKYPSLGACGILWGGNLATIISLFGAPYETYIPNEDIILFIEDINEPDYKIDRMLTQILRNTPLKEKIKGVIFGEFIGTGEYLNDILKEFASALNVPRTFDPSITHGKANTVVPFGMKI